MKPEISGWAMEGLRISDSLAFGLKALGLVVIAGVALAIYVLHRDSRL